MGFNPLKLIGKAFGGGPLVKAEGIADQIQDKQAERRWATAAIIFASLAGAALLVFAIKGC